MRQRNYKNTSTESNRKRTVKVGLFISLALSISSCSSSAINSDWDELSSGQRAQICLGVDEFGADTAAGLEYTLNSDYSKDDLAVFLRGKC